MAPRSPHLHHALRAFTLGAFAYLLRELDDAGESLPFAFEEHEAKNRPALYEYRPLVRDFVESNEERLRGREDALIALEELQREPAAGIARKLGIEVQPVWGAGKIATEIFERLSRSAARRTRPAAGSDQH